MQHLQAARNRVAPAAALPQHVLAGPPYAVARPSSLSASPLLIRRGRVPCHALGTDQEIELLVSRSKAINPEGDLRREETVPFL